MSRFLYLFAGLLCLFFVSEKLSAQTEVQAWSNITGIRVSGQMYRFESSLRLVENDWQQERATAQERNWSTFQRKGDAKIVICHIDSLFFSQSVRDNGPGKASVQVVFDPRKDKEIFGTFFHLNLPAADFSDANIQMIDPAALDMKTYTALPVGENEIMRVRAKGLTLESSRRTMTVLADEPVIIIVKLHPVTGDLGLYFTLQTGAAKMGQQTTRLFDIAVQGVADTATVTLKLFPDYPGNTFLGFGGNFRLQNAETDPQVIDYCLNNMDVRMGRVELPWQLWHPIDTIDPLATARREPLHPHVKASMEMAQRLYKTGMPVLLAAWYPPHWAAEGKVERDPHHPDGTYGNPLRQDKMEEIYASITSYILYLKENYGVEISMFSFNESDLGINVRQTPEEHAALIKGLGAYMRSKGLKTKLLLGDTADANGFEFVNAALDDPETWDYIGAVSFHSWRGWEKETLLEWYEAADRLNVPLIVGEGSIDAAAWRYPVIFEESHYAMEEIKLYIRILAICQPQAILQWQLTADYSPLSGGGIFGNDKNPLQPTQRFWNLKQLAHTPAGLQVLPLTSDADEMYVTALGDPKQKHFVLHIVNDGPAREVILTGLPPKLKRLQLYMTDKTSNMEKGEQYDVKEGRVNFSIGSACFVSLMSE